MAQPEYPDARIADDEISLIDLWQVLRRRKYWIVIVLVATLLLAAGWLATKTPIYEAQATLEVGSIGGAVLEEPGVLTNRLKGLQSNGVGPATRPVLTDAQAEGRIVELTAQAPTQDAANAFITEQSARVVDRHAEYLTEFRAEQQDRLKELAKRIAAIQNQYDQFGRRLSELGPGDAAIGGLLTLEQRLYDHLPQLEKEQAKLRRALTDRETYPTKVLVGPEAGTEDTASAAPVEPRTRLVIALALVLGLMLGIFVAFFREFLARAGEADSDEEGTV